MEWHHLKNDTGSRTTVDAFSIDHCFAAVQQCGSKEAKMIPDDVPKAHSKTCAKLVAFDSTTRLICLYGKIFRPSFKISAQSLLIVSGSKLLVVPSFAIFGNSRACISVLVQQQRRRVVLSKGNELRTRFGVSIWHIGGCLVSSLATSVFFRGTHPHFTWLLRKVT